jgi:hypothetical protein
MFLFLAGLTAIFVGFRSMGESTTPREGLLSLLLPAGLILALCGLLFFFVPHFFRL